MINPVKNLYAARKPHSTKLIAVIGPTASGKTTLAIKLAKKFNGELINADSRQIYKYLDIGTAKGEVTKIPIPNNQLPNLASPEATPKASKSQITNHKSQNLEVYEIEGVPIHLINIVEPDEVLTLAQYQKLAYAAIGDIRKRSKLPILVGGTGLYVDAVVKGYQIPQVKPDEKLRSQLVSKSVDQLQKILVKLNKKRLVTLNESDKANKHRLIRLIEIEKALKGANRKLSKAPNLKVIFLTPAYTREKLYKTINRRAKIITDSGLIDEVKDLIKKDYKFSKPAMTAISYPFVKEYLDGKITKEELLKKFRQGDRNYARRQITWFKRYPVVFAKNDEQVLKVVNGFLKS